MEVRSDALVHIFGVKTTHEDTYVIIPHQVVALADVGCKTINVICDEHRCVCTTRPLLCRGKSVRRHPIMDPTSRSRSSIDIGTTVTKHSGIVPQLIAAHAVSGCDTVGCYHSSRKTNVVKLLVGRD